MNETILETDDYDNPWKEAITLYFPSFIQFYFPEIYQRIDWSYPPEFLDKELQTIVRDSETGKQYADKLVKVRELNGQETWVLIHIEIQSQKDAKLTTRIYFYYTRILDTYGQPVVSLVILADKNKNWKPQEHKLEKWGCEMVLKFPVVKLLDYNLEELENSNNPFAIITLAHLTTLKNKHKPKQRYEGKIKLVKKLYQAGYSRKDILELFRLIDWIINLPKNWQTKFDQDLNEFEEERKMPYLTSIERSALERGEIKKSREDILEVLQIRFNSVPESLINLVNEINDQQILKDLLRQAVITVSLTEFEAFLNSLNASN